MEQINHTKIMVLGFDGASLNVLLPLIEQGKLPHLNSLMREGLSGTLRSTTPPLSGPAWTTFATGVNPGKHGIFDFFRNIPSEGSCTPINSSFVPVKTLWEILSEHGKKVGVMNMLFTYPPQKVNGFVVSGRGTPGEEVQYSYPESIKKEILAFDPLYRVEAYTRISQTTHFLKLLLEQIRRQEKVNQYLFAKYPCDFTASYFGVPDLIQHIFWKHMDPAHPHYNRRKSAKVLPLIEECLRLLDSIVGERLQMIDSDTILLVMSDHGAGPLHKTLQLNKWLQQERLLCIKEKYQSRRVKWLRLMGGFLKGALNIASGLDIFGLRRRIGFKTREKRIFYRKKMLVDWSRTKAYAGRIAELGIHINLEGREQEGSVREGEEYEVIRDSLISGLSALSDPENGEKIFRKIWKREELYRGPHVSKAPDLIVDFGDNPYMPGDSLLTNTWLERVASNGVTGMHRNDGILMIQGKGIRENAEIKDANICDLAPTILYLMGIDIPEYMDGRVLPELVDAARPYAPGRDREREGQRAAPEQEKETMVFNETESENIAKKLKDLGYL